MNQKRPTKETCIHEDVLYCPRSDPQHMLKGTHVRDLYESKETYMNQKRPTKETYIHEGRALYCPRSDPQHMLKGTHIRDLYESKETYKRDPYTWGTCFVLSALRSTTHFKRDSCKRPLYESKETSINLKETFCWSCLAIAALTSDKCVIQTGMKLKRPTQKRPAQKTWTNQMRLEWI